MNKLSFKNPKVNNGEEIYFYTVDTKDGFCVQLGELLIEEHYKSGLIKKDMVVVDCGANVGIASYYFKDWAKQIYALEPNSKNYECLVRNVEEHKLDNVKTYKFGLAARKSVETLRTNGDTGIAESLFGSGLVSEPVTLLSIKDFMDKEGIDHIDLLKMDTEGSEYIIFPSHDFELLAPKIDYIIGESHYLANLVPDYLVPVLDDVGFDVKFLPITNMFLKFSFDDVVHKQYSIDKQTLFLAKRKDLPWPEGLN